MKLQHLPLLTKWNLHWNTSQNLEVKAEQAPASQRDWDTCNNPIGLQIKSKKKTKQDPQTIWISTSSSIISYRNEIFVSTEERTRATFLAHAKKHGTHFTSRTGPKVPEKCAWKHIMGNHREVEMKKGKTFNTISEGKAQQKKQRNSLSTQAALVWTGLEAAEITAGSQTRNTEVKNRGGELFSVSQVTNF